MTDVLILVLCAVSVLLGLAEIRGSRRTNARIRAIELAIWPSKSAGKTVKSLVPRRDEK